MQANKEASAATEAPSGKLTTDIIARHEKAYIQRLGLSIFPVIAGDKRPLTRNGFKDAVRSVEEYNALHGGQPHNIGMPTGKVNGVFVLDVDPRHGGFETIRALCTQYGPMPSTWSSMTQSGGAHYFFRWDDSRPVTNRVDLLPGLDIRGDGGYVLLPPSRVDGDYEWVGSPRKRELLDAPEWLYALLGADSAPESKDLSHLAEGVTSGSRNVSMTELCGMLLGRGVPVKLAWTLVYAYNQFHCSPPLEEEELLRTFESIANREIAKRARRRGRIRA